MANEKTDLEDRILGLGKAYPDEESQELVSSWAARLRDIRASESFLEHPETQRLREIAEEEIARITHILATKEDLDEPTRKSLFRLREAHNLYRDFTLRDPEKDRTELEDEMTVAEQNAEEEL